MTVTPGARVRGSTSGRPIMALLDLLGRRWALRILWELRDEVRTFRALQAACGDISPTVLNTRLAELRDAGIVAAGDGGYALTKKGGDLLAALMPLNQWAEEWAAAISAAGTRDRP